MDTGLVLYLGVVRRGEYESLLDLGLPLGVLVDTNTPLRLADTSRFALVQRFDFSRPRNELVGQVLEIKARYGLSCLINMVEHYVSHAADVAAAVGMPGISPAAARVCLDKVAMRRRFQERVGPRSTARFRAVHNEAELLGFGRGGLPGVLAAGQPLQQPMVHAERHGGEAACQLLRHAGGGAAVLQGDRPGRKAADGPGLGIPAGGEPLHRLFHRGVRPRPHDAGGRRADRPGHRHRRLPPLRPDRALRGVAGRGGRPGRAGPERGEGIGMASCAAHVEFIGPRLGEAGARPGGNRPRILEMVYGINAIRAYYKVLRGEDPELRRSRQRPAAIVTPFPRRRGILRAVNHLDELPRLLGYSYHEQRTPVGKEVGLARDGFGAPLYVELTSDDADEVRSGVDRIASWHDLFEVE